MTPHLVATGATLEHVSGVIGAPPFRCMTTPDQPALTGAPPSEPAWGGIHDRFPSRL
jgi:hypothetical protein